MGRVGRYDAGDASEEQAAASLLLLSSSKSTSSTSSPQSLLASRRQDATQAQAPPPQNGNGLDALLLAVGVFGAVIIAMLASLFAPSMLAAVLAAGRTASAAATRPSSALPSDCPAYVSYASSPHPPLTTGRYKLPFQRPRPECRTASFAEVEQTIEDMAGMVRDPDLFRLFENAFPNTLDTTVSWHGSVDGRPEEELTFIVTGDINAMWLRDSANQLQSYRPLLKRNSSTASLASLFRGAINLQGRYIQQAPFCNAFQPPPESGLGETPNDWAARDAVRPSFPRDVVFECKYELDSLAAFLQLSYDYYAATGDGVFFARFNWTQTVKTILDTAESLRVGTYGVDGTVISSPFSFQRQATTTTETVANKGEGEPVNGSTGMVRSWFRPSDDSCIYQLFVPANMMFARYLAACAEMMKLTDPETADRMRRLAGSVREGIEAQGRYKHPVFGEIYAYEVDGFGSYNAMDDANIPSLLSAPMLGYLDRTDPVYRNTRRFVLSASNPYYMRGPVINATGGPHIGPGMAWPMGLVVQLLTSDDDGEIMAGLKALVGSTDGLGLIHESVNSHDASGWTRQWFAWANGLFGQMMLDLRDRKPHLLGLSYQGNV